MIRFIDSSAEVYNTDVLIIGGGLAGSRAAIESYDHGAQVTMVMRDNIGQGGATGPWWYGGISIPNGDTDPEDNPEEFYKDIVLSAWGMCDEKLARILAYEIIDRYKELEDWGLASPEKVEGKYHQHAACFHNRPRAIKLFGFSPNGIELLKQQVERRNIMVIDDVFITSLLVKDGTCVGALGVDKGGRFNVLKSKSTIMASGGAAAVFPPVYYSGAIGSAYSMGFHTGAQLMNMEFIQIMPELCKEFKIIPHFLNPDMYNRFGERFLPKYLPKGITEEECFIERMKHVPFSTRDAGKYIDIAIYKEIIEERGTEENSIYLDVTHISKKDAWLAMEAASRTYMFGPMLDTIIAERQQVKPHAHAFNGGLNIDEKTATSVPGLYAAGEAAGGPHGADRLGGNMVAACLVFGARAGRFSAERANNIDGVTIEKEQVEEAYNKATEIINGKGSLSVSEIENKIRNVMWRSCLTIRNKEGLESCIDELRRIRREESPKMSVSRNEDIFRALSIPHMLDVGEIIAFAALQRKESRGSHFREDYPENDDENYMRIMYIDKGRYELGV